MSVLHRVSGLGAALRRAAHGDGPRALIGRTGRVT